MKMKTTIALATLLISGLLPGRAEEAPPATLPYRVVCRIAQLDFSDTTGFTNQLIRFSVASQDPDIPVADIRMWIEAKSGPIPLPIGADGELSLPILPELWEENPPIVANQPKGSMELSGFMCVQGSFADAVSRENEGRIRYSALFVAEDAKRRIAGNLTEMNLAPEIEVAMSEPTAVQLRARSRIAEAAVTILAEGGSMAVPPEEPGCFRIEYDSGMMAEDPWVQIGTGHEWSIRLVDGPEAAAPAAAIPEPR